MSEATSTSKKGPPQEVIDEFNASLDSYVDDWSSQIAKRVEGYEADQAAKEKAKADPKTE